MTDPKPIVNLADVALKPGGNGGKFVRQGGRVGPQLGLKKLGCGLFVVPQVREPFPTMRIR